MSQAQLYSFLCVLFAFSQESLGLSDGALYMVQNTETKQCLTAGPIIQSTYGNATLFKKGIAMPNNCSDMIDPTAMKFGQEWLVRIKKENPPKFFYQVQLAMRNSQYNETKLNAHLNGEFVEYFPDVINLQGSRPLDQVDQSQEFIIYDSTFKHCLLDQLEKKRIIFAKCSQQKGKLQMWKFILVNHKKMYTIFNHHNSSQFH